MPAGPWHWSGLRSVAGCRPRFAPPGSGWFIEEVRRLAWPGFDGAIAHCTFREERCDGTSFARHGIECPPPLRRASRRRLATYLAGRLAAAAAQRELRRPDEPVGMSPERLPEWPRGLCGSLSHTDRSAVCALASTSQYAAVGVDVERWLDDAQAATIADQVMDDAERRRFSGLGDSTAAFVTLLFSAKESLYKALYPSVRRYFDFLDAEVTGIDPAARRIALRLKTRLSMDHAAGRRFTGSFLPLDDEVITLISH
ncbi:MAG: 4'-phosphopantetheinyl transferase superfamily protein [Solimonas sp.]